MNYVKKIEQIVRKSTAIIIIAVGLYEVGLVCLDRI